MQGTLIGILIVLMVIILIIVGIIIYRAVYNKKLNKKIAEENRIYEEGGVPERKEKKMAPVAAIGTGAGILCICLSLMLVTVSCMYRLSSENSGLYNRINQLENQIKNLLNEQLVEQRKANSLLSSFDITPDFENVDYETYTIQLDISIMPKEVTDTTVVELKIDNQVFDTTKTNASFNTTITRSIFYDETYDDCSNISVIITDNNVSKVENIMDSSIYDYYPLTYDYSYLIAPDIYGSWFNSLSTKYDEDKQKLSIKCDIEVNGTSSYLFDTTKAEIQVKVNNNVIYTQELDYQYNGPVAMGKAEPLDYRLRIDETFDNIDHLDTLQFLLHVENEKVICEYNIDFTNYNNVDIYVPSYIIKDRAGNILEMW